VKLLKTILALIVVAPFTVPLILFFSPFIVIQLAFDYLDTRNMTPEELAAWKENRKFLSNKHSGHAYAIV